MPEEPAPANVFDSIKSFSMRHKTVRLADPDDILATVPKWSPEQLKIPEELRELPANGYRIEIKPGAATMEFSVRRLTSSEREQCNRILDAVLPKEKTETKPNPVRGEPPITLRVGFDDEHPEYLARRREAQSNQFALVALTGVSGLMEATPGATPDEKIAEIRKSYDEHLIRILAAEIWGRTYSGGDPADFFMSANS